MPRKKQVTGVQRALDAVSQDAWRSLYQAAAEVGECAPWKRMSEDEIFAFVMPDGTEWFVSVMGLLGEYRAVAVYPVAEALNLFRQAHLFDTPQLAQEQALGTPQLHLSYEGASALEPAEKPLLKSLGVTAISRRWPIARSMRPGHLPFILEPDEVEVLRTGLEQLIAVLRLSSEERLPGPDLQELLVRRRVKDSWRSERRELESAGYPFAIRLQHDWQPVLNGLPQGRAELEIDLVPLPGGLGTPGERLARPELLVVVDARSGVVMCMEVLAPEPTWYAMRESLPAKLLQLIATSGERPARIAVRAAFLSALEQVFDQIDIPFKNAQRLPALDRVLAAASQRGLL